jgi:hypothetical protein
VFVDAECNDLQIGAGTGNRTRLSTLGRSHISHYTIPASKLRLYLVLASSQKLRLYAKLFLSNFTNSRSGQADSLVCEIVSPKWSHLGDLNPGLPLYESGALAS